MDGGGATDLSEGTANNINNTMCVGHMTGGEEEGDIMSKMTQQQHQDVQDKSLTKDSLRGAVFAQTLQRRLRRLQGGGRRTSEPTDAAAAAAEEGPAGMAKDDLFLNGAEERGMSFMLGRFLSGSDPSLCSTITSHCSSSSSSSSSRSNSLEGGGGANLDVIDIDDDVEVAEEAVEDSKTAPSVKTLCSSGYGSEPDMLSTVSAVSATDAADPKNQLLVPQAWVDTHFVIGGDTASIDDDMDGSGISTPIASAALVRETSPAFDCWDSSSSAKNDGDGFDATAGGSVDDILSSTPRADDHLTVAMRAAAGSSPVYTPKKEEEASPEPHKQQPDFLTITSGEEKHLVATSKLNALLSLLDSGGNSSTSSCLKKRRSKDKLFDSAPDLSAKDFSGGVGGCLAPVEIVVGGSSGDIGPKSLNMDDELRAQKPNKMRRASSLKSGKTPPGTPGRAKMVKFADVMGLDLADVKHFFDEVPRVPRSAYDDLEFDHPEDENTKEQQQQQQHQHDPFPSMPITFTAPPRRQQQTTSLGVLVPMFAQPGSQPDVHDVLRSRRVCLDRAHSPRPGALAGSLWVRNLGFEKRVSLRYSLDEWATSQDAECTYVPDSCDGFSDKFEFRVEFPPVAVGRRLHFCLRFEAPGAGGEFWDSNGGNNYVFQCVAAGGGGGGAGGQKNASEDPWFQTTHY